MILHFTHPLHRASPGSSRSPQPPHDSLPAADQWLGMVGALLREAVPLGCDEDLEVLWDWGVQVCEES